jgi:acyl transferase domain-containing protein
MGIAEKHSMDGQEPRLPPIAIIGMSCRLPGNVSTVEDFWHMMSRARCGWSEIPGERFNIDAYHHPNPAKKGCFNAKGGYFLSQDPGLFDAPFFNLTRPEAEAMGMFVPGCRLASDLSAATH